MDKVKELISLLEMMAKNDLATWKDGTKINTDSYLKGKGDRTLEIINMLKQGGEKDADNELAGVSKSNPQA
jgi:hypothetical protein